MALVNSLTALEKERCSPHGEVECTYTIFTDHSGRKYLQLDTYGSATRQIPNKVSQSLQFSAQSLQQLKNILDVEFPALNVHE